MCPSYRITLDPAHSTGAGQRPLRRRSTESWEYPFTIRTWPPPWTLRLLQGLQKECPSAVDMTLIKTEYLAQKNEREGISLRTRLFAGLPRWLHRWRRPLAALVRWRNASRRWRGWRSFGWGWPLPAYPAAGRTILRHAAGRAGRGSGDAGQGAALRRYLFHHYTPEVAEAAVKVLRAGGYRVDILRPAPGDPRTGTAPVLRPYLSLPGPRRGQPGSRRGGSWPPWHRLSPKGRHRRPRTLPPAGAAGRVLQPPWGRRSGQLGKQAFLSRNSLMREGNKGLKLPLTPLPGGRR